MLQYGGTRVDVKRLICYCLICLRVHDFGKAGIGFQPTARKHRDGEGVRAFLRADLL